MNRKRVSGAQPFGNHTPPACDSRNNDVRTGKPLLAPLADGVDNFLARTHNQPTSRPEGTMNPNRKKCLLIRRLAVWLAALALVPAVPASAQLVSLQPLYSEKNVQKTVVHETPNGPRRVTFETTENDVVFDPRLVGAWGDPEEEKPYLVFEPGENGSYKVTLRDSSDVARFQVYLVRLGEFTFLDAAPDDTALRAWLDENNEDLWFLVGLHVLCLVRLDGDLLRLSYLDTGLLAELDEAERVRMAVEVKGEGPVLILPTRQLQALVLKYAEVESAFSELGELRRLK